MSRNEHFDAGRSEHGAPIDPNTTIPPELGKTPVPAGHVRLYHQTDPSNVPAIMQAGLRADLGGKAGDPPGLWMSSGEPFYRHSHTSATIEAHVPVEHLTDAASDTRHVRNGTTDPHEWQEETHPVVLRTPVSPRQFVGVHLPWHAHARYFLKEGMQEQVRSGEFDDLLDNPEYGPAIRHVKGESP